MKRHESSPSGLLSISAVVLSALPLLVGLPSVARAFSKSVESQGVTWDVESSGEGSMQTLALTTRGTGVEAAPVKKEVDGQVVGAEAADLDGNGRPELYVFVQSAGSGGYGSVEAFGLTKKGRLVPILMPELTGKAAEGYMGHDRFSTSGACLLRQFPVYKEHDSNAQATGGSRRVCYGLRHRGPRWSLQPGEVTTLPE